MNRTTPGQWDEERGQSTVEWVGLVLLVSILFAGLVVTVSGTPGVGLAHSISTRMLCAVSLSDACDHEVTVTSIYGPELATKVKASAPELLYGRDMLGLPVDYRTCRSPWCADGKGQGRITESTAGEPVTLFTRVLDCREGRVSVSSVADCDDRPEGSVYIQYWAYYPESASLRGAPVLEAKGYHPNDWESTQVRINSDGTIDQRSSSHNGYNHDRSVVNWASDMGWGFGTDATEKLGLRGKGGWGDATGDYLVAGGSHAGNVDGPRGDREYPSWTPASDVRLVPLEKVRGQSIARAARFDPITPPWKKDVWTDPEADGTG